MMNVRRHPHTPESPDMLDAFIIEKIQRERELRDSGREQLRIEVPLEPNDEGKDRDGEDKPERGITIVDFNI